MPENSSDDAVLLDEGQNPHLGPAIGAGQRVSASQILAMSRRHWAEVAHDPADREVMLRFHSTPVGAEVSVAEEALPRGSTPFSFSLPQSKIPTRVTLRAKVTRTRCWR